MTWPAPNPERKCDPFDTHSSGLVWWTAPGGTIVSFWPQSTEEAARISHWFTPLAQHFRYVQS